LSEWARDQGVDFAAFGQGPNNFANLQTWWESITATGSPAAARAATTAVSQPPVALTTTRGGLQAFGSLHQARHALPAVVHLEAFLAGAHACIQVGLADVDAESGESRRWGHHGFPPCATQNSHILA